VIEEQAQVVDVQGEHLILQAQTQSACGSCSAKKGCGTSVLAKVVGKKFSRFQAMNNVDAKVGDTVVVGIAEDALLSGSAVMYFIPVLGMIVFALMADYLLILDYDQRDLYVALISILGLAAGSLFSKWYFLRHRSSRKYTPVVLRKLL
jgi:sigma-E factor negative regulatory protein RseC